MFNSKKISLLPFVISIQGYLFLSWLFIQTLLHPVKNLNLLYTTGIVILIFEFLNIHSNTILNLYRQKMGKEIELFPKLLLLFIYSVFIIFLSIFSGNIYISIIFFVSLISKVLANKIVSTDLNFYRFKLYMAALIIAILGASLWEYLFYFPQEIYNVRPDNTTGILVDRPQTLVIWAIFYYFFLGITEIILLIREIKKNKSTQYLLYIVHSKTK